MPKGTCCEPACVEPARCKERCGYHYNKWRFNPRNPNAKPCSREMCLEPAKTRGMCQAHYNEWYYREGRKLGRARTCEIEGCDRQHHSNGFCNWHYYRSRNNLPMDTERLRMKKTPIDARTCQVEGCEKPLGALRMCSMHYQRYRTSGDPMLTVGRARGKWNLCEVQLCPERPVDHGLCEAHDQRYLAGVPLGGVRHGRRRLSDEGYVWTRTTPDHVMWRATGYLPEHRLIMSDLLSRALEDDENVHHLNGNRSDNTTDGPLRLMPDGKLRSGNLELWVKSQPSGQRPADLVAWAHQIIDRYGPLIEQAA